MKIWVYNFAYPVTVLGPGRRLALWVSGCRLGCPGCMTPMLWDRHAGVSNDTSSVARRLLAIDCPLDGLTLTGGEPFEQAAALSELVRLINAERPHWSVLVYSGHTLAALRKMGANAAALLTRIDVLIAGAYRIHLPSRHPLAGSGNQRIHLLSERGSEMVSVINFAPFDRVNIGLDKNDNGDWLIGVMESAARRKFSDALNSASMTSVLGPQGV